MSQPANAQLDRRGFLKATGAALAFLTVLDANAESARAGGVTVAEPQAAKAHPLRCLRRATAAPSRTR